MNTQYWGKHLIISAINLDKEKVLDKELISDFFIDVVDKIKMKRMIDPIVIYCDTGDKEKAGNTAFVIIETSNLSAHFLNDGSVMFDCFSCMDFDRKIVENLLIDWFSSKDNTVKIVESKMLKRTFKESLLKKLLTSLFK